MMVINKPQRYAKGFTLIELMIVVAIIGILAAVSYPSYVGYVVDSRRAEGMSALLMVASQHERLYSQNSVYGALGPIQSENGYYTVTTVATPTTYVLTATPAVADALCGNFSLTSAGFRDVDGDFDGDTVVGGDADDIAGCWR
jgi:type IV pilus assembly protein PilE